MLRRVFFKTPICITLIPAISKAASKPAERSLLLQESPAAGFQYYDGNKIWGQLRQGDQLKLSREPGNRYDRQAVTVYWRKYKLGYLPRYENTAVAQMLDRGMRLNAHITGLRESTRPMERVRLSVSLDA